jgi:hypothetical protein
VQSSFLRLEMGDGWRDGACISQEVPWLWGAYCLHGAVIYALPSLFSGKVVFEFRNYPDGGSCVLGTLPTWASY